MRPLTLIGMLFAFSFGATPAPAATIPPGDWITIQCKDGRDVALEVGDIAMPPSVLLKMNGCVPVDPAAVPPDPPLPPAPTGAAIIPPSDPSYPGADPSIYVTVKCQNGQVWNFVKNNPLMPIPVQEALAGCVPVP